MSAKKRAHAERALAFMEQHRPGKLKPFAPLPFATRDAAGTVADTHVLDAHRTWVATAYRADAAYLAHAANAYQKLVAALRGVIDCSRSRHMTEHAKAVEVDAIATTVLRELGEDV